MRIVKQTIEGRVEQIVAGKNPSKLEPCKESVEFKSVEGFGRWCNGLRNVSLIDLKVTIAGRDYGRWNVYGRREIVTETHTLTNRPPVFGGIKTKIKSHVNKYAAKSTGEELRAFADYNAKGFGS